MRNAAYFKKDLSEIEGSLAYCLKSFIHKMDRWSFDVALGEFINLLESGEVKISEENKKKHILIAKNQKNRKDLLLYIANCHCCGAGEGVI